MIYPVILKKRHVLQILQTWTGPDLNDSFRFYICAPSEFLYKSEILFVSYIESRFYTPA